MFEIPKDRGWQKNAKFYSLIFLFISSSLSALLFIGGHSVNAESNELFPTSKVNIQSLSVQVSGYGKLVPQFRRGINSLSSGHIIEISLRPGALVKSGDVIVKLENPKLRRGLETSELELLEEKANQQKTIAESVQALEEQRNKIRLAKVKLALAEAELSAHKKLEQEQVISSLELHKASVVWEQEHSVLTIEKSRLQTLKKTREAMENSAFYRLQKARKHHELLEQEVAQLDIKASMDGMVTELATDLEIGRYLDEGQVVGMIADLSSFYARLNITAADAEFVHSGLEASIAVKGKEVQGKVTRVEPKVSNGSVEIDISFSQTLPAAARPNIDVKGRIQVVNHGNTLVVERPIGVTRPHESYSLYVLDKVSQEYSLRKVSVGDIADNQMQLIAGISEGEEILLKVPAHLATVTSFSNGALYE